MVIRVTRIVSGTLKEDFEMILALQLQLQPNNLTVWEVHKSHNYYLS